VRYLIISDVHANRHALEAVLADAASHGYDATLCLGDIVGYGADPSAALELTLGLEPVGLIRGNHDKVCAGLEPATSFNDVARRAVEWTRRTLSEAELTTLAALPRGPVRITSELEICHGTPFDEDHYVFDRADAGRAMSSASARICLFGHTHLPALYSTPAHPVAYGDRSQDEYQLPREGAVLINVGSVGQPRDGDPRAAYGLLDLEKSTVQLRRVGYDVAGAQEAIRAAGLPAWLATRLATGE
jgi:diadenosine tetraphosphatase ApaH/serine/threonine PP2A family protein phosphatase